MEYTNEIIITNIDSILSKIEQESIDVYLFIKKEFENKGVNKPFFQFVYRNYYGLDNAGLSPDFKKKYFEILENSKLHKMEFKEIVKELYKCKNIKGQESLQISFTSKLMHTLDNTFPIYDSKIESLMSWNYIQKKNDIDGRISLYKKRLNDLSEIYRYLINYNGGAILKKFDKKFNNDLSNEKKIDFILWTAGKMKIGVIN